VVDLSVEGQADAYFTRTESGWAVCAVSPEGGLSGDTGTWEQLRDYAARVRRGEASVLDGTEGASVRGVSLLQVLDGTTDA
jgi:hypothetical protein